MQLDKSGQADDVEDAEARILYSLPATQLNRTTSRQVCVDDDAEMISRRGQIVVHVRDVTDLFDQAVRGLDRELALIRATIVAEVEQLGRTICTARHEVMRLREGNASAANPFPDAADELDAIVEHTEQATGIILEASEALDAIADGLALEAAEAIRAETMRIFEACAVQDITGQRISKVVAALQIIEDRVEALTGTWGGGVVTSQEVGDPLLNGPQREEAAISQDAVDKLLMF